MSQIEIIIRRRLPAVVDAGRSSGIDSCKGGLAFARATGLAASAHSPLTERIERDDARPDLKRASR